MLYILWGSKGDKWEMVCLLSETMSTIWLTPWEAMKSHVGSCWVWEMCGKIPRAQIQLAGPAFPRGSGTTNSIILVYKCYIYILLININSLIYICYILYEGARGISEKRCACCWKQWAQALLDVAEGGTCVGVLGTTPVGTIHMEARSRTSKTGNHWILLDTTELRHTSKVTGECHTARPV
jgi:hypothetical protein